MQNQDNDIDQIITELEHLNTEPEDADRACRFAGIHAPVTITLLEELKSWRSNARKEQQDSRRLIIEGFLDESAHEAFSDALHKASCYFSEAHDTHISMLELTALPRGGHRAMVEVFITPLSHGKMMHPEGQDVELKHIHDHAYRHQKTREETHLKEIIHDHFLELSGGAPNIPDYFLINITDAELLNMMIEKEFFNAGHKGQQPPKPGPTMVKVKRPGPKPGEGD